MTVHIESVGVEVPGRVVRSYSEDTKTTTLLLSGAQVRALNENTGLVVQFFDMQEAKA